MIDEEFYDNLPNDLYDEYQSSELFAMETIATEIGKVKAADDTELIKLGSKAAKALVVKKILDKIFKSVAKTDKIVYNQLRYASIEEYKDLKITFKELPPFNRQKAINDILERVANETGETLRNYSETTGFVDQFGVWKPIRRFYSDGIDSCIKSVRLGEEIYWDTSKKLIKNMADSGLSYGTNKDGTKIVDYPSGYKRRLDSSIRNAFMGGQQRLSKEQAEIMAKEIDANAWQISYLFDSAQGHEFMNGRFFTQKKFDELNIDNHLLRYNCRHRKFAAVEGISKPNWTDEQLNQMNIKAKQKQIYKGKEYDAAEARDRKRILETNIRRQKDRVKMFDVAKNDKAMQEELAKLQNAQREYNAFTKAMGIKKEPNRTSVQGFGKAFDYVR